MIIILLLDTSLVPFIGRPAGSGTLPLWFPLRGYAKHPNRALQGVLPSEEQVCLVARNLSDRLSIGSHFPANSERLARNLMRSRRVSAGLATIALSRG